MKKSVAIGIAILILVGLGFLLMNGISGNVILGSTVSNEHVENEYFQVDSVDVKLNGEVGNNDTRDFGGSG